MGPDPCLNNMTHQKKINDVISNEHKERNATGRKCRWVCAPVHKMTSVSSKNVMFNTFPNIVRHTLLVLM